MRVRGGLPPAPSAGLMTATATVDAGNETMDSGEFPNPGIGRSPIPPRPPTFGAIPSAFAQSALHPLQKVRRVRFC